MDLIRSPKLWSKFLKNNGYILHHCIGTGSFGDVFVVTKATTGMKWALKRIVVRRSITEDKYTMSEIKALMEFDHPNIVGMEEFILCKNLACIVLELAAGGSLEMMINEYGRNINDPFIRISFGQILSAVDYCHALDFAHRDINPSNILIFSDNLVKLADFGLCVRCSDVTSGRAVLCSDYLGQDAFLAPEVKLREPFHAKPADVWSLGCVLFFMIQRVNPRDVQTELWELAEKFKRELFLLNNKSTSETAYLNLIKKACISDPADRPTLPELISAWKV